MFNISELDFQVVLYCYDDFEILKNLVCVNKNFNNILSEPLFWEQLTQKFDKIQDNIVDSLQKYKTFLRVIQYLENVIEDDDSSDTVSFVLDAEEVQKWVMDYSKDCKIYSIDDKITSKSFESEKVDYEYCEYNDLAMKETNYYFTIHYHSRLNYFTIEFIIKDFHYFIYGLNKIEITHNFYDLAQKNIIKNWLWC